MSRATVKLLSVVNIVVTMVLVLLTINIEVLSVMFVLAGLVISVILNYKLRCPHCGRWPRRGYFFHQYCPRCGEPLE